MATHSSVLAWRIPGTGEPGGLPSMGSHRVGYYWSDLAAAEQQQQHPLLIIPVQFSCSVVSYSMRPMNRCTSGLPVEHQLLEFTQTHALWVGDAIQPFHPLSPPSPPALNLFQHQGLQKLDRHICFSVLFHWYMCSLFCSIDICVCSSSSTVLCWYCTYVESLNRRMIPPIVPSLTKLS